MQGGGQLVDQGGRERGGVGVLELGQRPQDGRVRTAGQRPDPIREVGGQAGGEGRTDERGTQGDADLAEEVVAAGGRAQVLGRQGVLHHGDQELEEQPDARPHEEGGRGDLPDGRRRRQAGEPEGSAGGNQGSRHRVDLVAVGARDEHTGEDRGDEHPDGDGHQEQAGGGGRVAVDHLEVGGQIAQHTDHAAHREHADERGDDEGAAGEDRPGQDGVGGARLDEAEQPPAHQADHAQADDDRAGPLVLVAAPGGHEDDGDGAGVHEPEPPPVNGAGQATAGQAQHQEDGDEGQDAQRQVDPEGPAPGDRVGEPATDDGSQDGGDAEHGSHGGHVGAAHARRDEVAGDRLGGDHEAAATQPLNEAVDDELGHGVGGAAQG